VNQLTRVRERHFGPWQLLRYGGCALLITTGAIHLDLYLTGYNTIPTIGWLFLMQVIAAFVLATATIASKGRLLSAASAGFLASTLVGYVLSLRLGLFGFREVRTTAGIVAGIVEIVGFSLLATYASRPEHRAQPTVSPSSRHKSNVDGRTLLAGRWVTGALTLLAAISLVLALPNASAPSNNDGGKHVSFKVADIHGNQVLTNAQGFTLYWFVPDSPSMSRCSATCAAYWPPVIGSPSPGMSIVGTFATLKRSNGAAQVTYNGHPLYTYVGDSAPGQANGNHIRLNGGWWYEMKVSK
jgi:predicted lipoprotein with Yx(FWY)xxD motif